MMLILSSPLQAVHAAHYIHSQNIEPGRRIVVALVNHAEQDVATIRKILSVFPCTFYEFQAPAFALRRVSPQSTRPRTQRFCYAIYNEFGVFFTRLTLVLSIAFFFLRIGTKVSTVVIGNYRSSPMRQFFRFFDMDTTRFVVVDDGSMTPQVLDGRHNGFPDNEVVSKAAVYARKLILPDPHSYVMPDAFTFYTLYDGVGGENDTIIRNTFYDDFADNFSVTVSNEVWICGANHVEAGIAELDAYVRVCTTVAGLYPGRKLVYYSHRREDPAKVALLAQKFGFERRAAPLGIEQEIASTLVAPERILSFGSTVLDTVPKMLRDKIEYLLIIPGNDYFTGKLQEHLIDVWRHNMGNEWTVATVFSADPNLRTRWELTLSKYARAAARHVPLPPRGGFVQVLPQAQHIPVVGLRLQQRRIAIGLASVTGGRSGTGNVSADIMLRYTPMAWSDFFPATIPLVLSRYEKGVRISSNAQTVSIDLQDPYDPEAAIELYDPFSGELRIAELGECDDSRDPALLYVLAC